MRRLYLLRIDGGGDNGHYCLVSVNLSFYLGQDVFRFVPAQRFRDLRSVVKGNGLRLCRIEKETEWGYMNASGSPPRCCIPAFSVTPYGL